MPGMQSPAERGQTRNLSPVRHGLLDGLTPRGPRRGEVPGELELDGLRVLSVDPW